MTGRVEIYPCCPYSEAAASLAHGQFAAIGHAAVVGNETPEPIPPRSIIVLCEDHISNGSLYKGAYVLNTDSRPLPPIIDEGGTVTTNTGLRHDWAQEATLITENGRPFDVKTYFLAISGSVEAMQ